MLDTFILVKTRTLVTGAATPVGTIPLQGPITSVTMVTLVTVQGPITSVTMVTVQGVMMDTEHLSLELGISAAAKTGEEETSLAAAGFGARTWA